MVGVDNDFACLSSAWFVAADPQKCCDTLYLVRFFIYYEYCILLPSVERIRRSAPTTLLLVLRRVVVRGGSSLRLPALPSPRYRAWPFCSAPKVVKSLILGSSYRKGEHHTSECVVLMGVYVACILSHSAVSRLLPCRVRSMSKRLAMVLTGVLRIGEPACTSCLEHRLSFKFQVDCRLLIPNNAIL